MPEEIKKTDAKINPKALPADTRILRDFSLSTKKETYSMKKLIPIALVIIVAGVLTGFVLAKAKNNGGMMVNSGTGVSTNKVVGEADVTGKDSAEGTLITGGLENEGTHHLERPGGPSQDVYLTSSVIPLDDYAEKKVKVWGDTFAAQSAGWLMDVVKLEVLE